jgi:uncharacterized damage-inducible protein DinB
MRGTLRDLHPVMAALLHSLEHAREDITKWTAGLTPEQLWREKDNLGSIGFYIRHLGGSAERLITYAKGDQLNETQLAELKAEKEPGHESIEQMLASLGARFAKVEADVRSLDPSQLGETRYLGRKRIPVTMAALVIHTAEHTQRHVGEIIVTSKVIREPGQ